MKNPPSKKELDTLVEEATIDCYDEEEQLGGFYCALEENLTLPFSTQVLGHPVSVKSLEQTDHDILANCHSGGHCQKISLLELPLPDLLLEGAEWILAFRHWRGSHR